MRRLAPAASPTLTCLTVYPRTSAAVRRNDDTEAKARAWERVFEAFRQEHGREPTVWLDEIVIDQSSLDDEAMMCLPANIMSCNKVMVLCGDTYIDRLWCIWCVHTCLALLLLLSRLFV